MSARTKLKTAVSTVVVRSGRLRGDAVASLIGRSVSGGTQQIDPYPIYDRLRRHELSKSMLGVYATASYDVAAAVLRDSRFSSSPWRQSGYRAPEYGDGDPRADLLGPETSLLSMEPPAHTRIRRLVSSAFTRRATEALEPFVREATVGLLDAIDVHAGFDLVNDFAFPLPIGVICHLLGVPADDIERFRRWGSAVAMTLEPRMTDEPDRVLVDAELALTRYLRDLITERRRNPDGTLLSALIAAEEEGDRLSEDELVSTTLLLLIAGFVTTVNLITNGTAALLDTPGVWEQLRHAPERWPEAVEEMLRYDSPVQLTSRFATEDIELAGTTLRKGSAVLVAIGGANRDPRAFAHPELFMLGRPDTIHQLSFSLGIHHCVGAALARLEARVAFEELTTRLERPVLAHRPVRRRSLVLRGYDSLPVRSLSPGERVETFVGESAV